MSRETSMEMVNSEFSDQELSVRHEDLTDAEVDSLPSTISGFPVGPDCPVDLDGPQVSRSLSDRLQVIKEGDWESMAVLVHDWAVSKGWYESGRSERMFVLLFQSEVFEAFEELRAGRMETWFSDDNGRRKPEGYWVELADVAIRILDYCGHVSIPHFLWWDRSAVRPSSHEMAIHLLVKSMSVVPSDIRYNLSFINSYLKANGQDLMSLVKLKMWHNLTRSHRHGNKLF